MSNAQPTARKPKMRNHFIPGSVAAWRCRSTVECLSACGEGASQFLRGCGWQGALSLTPALSRWERENPSRSSLMADTGVRGEISSQSVTVRSLFPLPAGEGQGEGESSDRMRSAIS